MIILVDQDGVLANLSEQFISDWTKEYPELPYIKHEDRKMFYMTDEYPKKYKVMIREIMHRKHFFRKLKPIPGALEALNKLKDLGHDVYICSAPFTKSRYCASEKHEWVKQHLGKDWERKLILTKDKTLIHGDYLIDDKPSVEGVIKPSWTHIVFNQPYNTNSKSKYRIDWDDYNNFLELLT